MLRGFKISLDIETEVSKLLKGIVICKETGVYLLDLILDSEINPVLLSSFVGALSLFGEENMGKIQEITIKGLDIQMIIVSKHNLILIAIMDKEFMKHNMREEAEKSLDMFYSLYKNEINECVDVCMFDSFKKILFQQIKEYFIKLKGSGDFGFFTETITRMRNPVG
ncbi:MAG: hypothetical protein ACXACC_03320 [Promethearchaeota archaeon]|jgi:hypothetical protein